MSSKKYIAMVRKEKEGLDAAGYTDFYSVPGELCQDKDTVLDYFKEIAKDYCVTESGQREYNKNGCSFDWNDFSNIPDTFLLKYGISRLPMEGDLICEVEEDEEIVKGCHVNYQIMTDSAKMSNGKYMPDWELLIRNAIDKNEASYLESVRDLQDKWMATPGWEGYAGFAYNMVYVTKMQCGHYEIFQTPFNQYYTLEDNLKQAVLHAANYKCTYCITLTYKK